MSQLSDSGQTLSEDSGVDIAEAGGLSKDSSPRPSKNQATQQSQVAQGPAALASKQVRATKGPYHNRNNMLVSQMKPFSIYSALRLTRAHSALLFTRALARD